MSKGMRPLTDQEVEILSKTFSGKYEKRDRALFLLGVKSGFRISELLSLCIGDVYKNGRMADRVYVARKNMKNQTEGRSVVLHPIASEALRWWLNELILTGHNSDTFIFKSRKGANRHITPVQAWRILTSVAEASLVMGRIGTHCMRKTFAGKVYEKLDHDIFKTQAALGHKNINSTISYLSFKQDEIDQAILSL